MENRPKITTLKQLKKGLNDYTKEYVTQKFTWKTASAWIEEFLKQRCEEIVLSALGFEYEDDKWRLDTSAERSIQDVIGDMAKHLAEKHIPELARAAEPKILAIINSKKTQKLIIEYYQDAFNSALWDKMRGWIEKRAETDVERLFKEHGEELLDSIKLKQRITLNDLTLVAAGDNAGDDDDET